MSAKVVAFLAFAVLSSASACRCRYAPTLQRSYFSEDVVNFVKAKVVAKDEESLENKYTLAIQENYKGCKPSPHVVVYSGTHSCGVQLEVSKSAIVLPIRGGKKPSIDLCDFISSFNGLSGSEKEFLDTRSACCNEICQCTNGESPVNCLVDPCEVTEAPCAEATKCVSNFCGGCLTDWFTSSGAAACV